jgi:hypothetical protein
MLVEGKLEEVPPSSNHALALSLKLAAISTVLAPF